MTGWIIAAWNYLCEAMRTHPFNLFTLLIAAGAAIYSGISARAARRQARAAELSREISERALGLQAVALKAQAEDTRKALEVAQRNADAAEVSASATKTLAEVGQRAWISVVDIKASTSGARSHPGVPNGSVHVVVLMRNGGNSPALEFVSSLWLELREYALAQIDATALDSTNAGVVGPHESLQLDPRSLQFTPEEWDQLQDRTQSLLLYGICRYKDIFKRTHHTRWCLRYVFETQQFAPWNSEVNTMD
jgi:hypothetical protein